MNQYPLVTIVGGSGFVGRHVVKLLAASGYRIRVLVRDCIAAEFLKTAGTPGQIVIEHADITRPETLAGKFTGSLAVISLVSILYQSGRQKFDAINVAGAKAVAAEAKKAGAQRLIHISALGIDQTCDTAYGRTKLAGEADVREAFPTATFLRPSLIIGPEDGFFQRFGRMSLILPVMPLIGGGKTKFQPVLVTDVASAILAALAKPETSGKTIELAGPHTYSMRELLQLMGSITKRKLRFISLPFGFARLQACGMELFSKVTPWAPMLTRDQVKLLKHDNVATAGAAGFSALGITPASIESQLPAYLGRFIKG
jgi:uncharacterized protein YbjT (DUF2867 family)